MNKAARAAALLAPRPERAHVQRAILSVPEQYRADPLAVVARWLHEHPESTRDALRSEVIRRCGDAEITRLDDALRLLGHARWSHARAIVALELTADPTYLVEDLEALGHLDDEDLFALAVRRVRVVGEALARSAPILGGPLAVYVEARS